jgi:hypothetical protein
MSKLVSNVPDPNHIEVENGKTYVMEVVLRKTTNFNMYSNPYAFGVPTSTGSVDWDSPDLAGRVPAGTNWPLHRGEFAPFTPPYFYGDSVAQIIYKPDSTTFESGHLPAPGVVSLKEIVAHIKGPDFSDSKINYYNSNDHLYDQFVDPDTAPTRRPDYGWNRAWLNKMNISASVVLTNEYKHIIDESFNLNQWVIMPKWESPILDFPREDTTTTSDLYNFSSSVGNGTYNSGSGTVDKTYGMWHQYGIEPQIGEGVKLMVRGLPSDSVLRTRTNLVSSAAAATAEASLIAFADNGKSTYAVGDWAYDPSLDNYILFTVKRSASVTYAIVLNNGSSPSSLSITGVTNIDVDISLASDGADVITSIVSALGSIANTTIETTAPPGSPSIDGGTIKITNDNNGPVTDVSVGAVYTVNSTQAVTVSTPTQGTDAGTALTATDQTLFSSVSDDSLGDLAALLGFTSSQAEREEPTYNTADEKVQETIRIETGGKSVRLGKLASKKTVYEAIAAIPYYLSGDEPNQKPNFIRIPPVSGNHTFGPEVLKLISKMERYNLPPALQDNLDRLKTHGTESLNREDGPVACYLFEFKIDLSKQDLADIWQGVMPEQSIRMLGKKGERTVYGIDHTLVYDHPYDQDSAQFGERLDSRLKDLMDVQEGFEETANSFRPEIQWLVFKVKQKGIGSYQEMITRELTPYMSGEDSTSSIASATSRAANIVERGYNWPYDYFSFVEMAKIEGQVRFRPHVAKLEGFTAEYNSPGIAGGIGSVTTAEFAPDDNADTEQETGEIPPQQQAEERYNGIARSRYIGQTNTVNGHSHKYILDRNKDGRALPADGTDGHIHQVAGGIVQAFGWTSDMEEGAEPIHLGHRHHIRF